MRASPAPLLALSSLSVLLPVLGYASVPLPASSVPSLDELDVAFTRLPEGWTPP